MGIPKAEKYNPNSVNEKIFQNYIYIHTWYIIPVFLTTVFLLAKDLNLILFTGLWSEGHTKTMIRINNFFLALSISKANCELKATIESKINTYLIIKIIIIILKFCQNCNIQSSSAVPDIIDALPVQCLEWKTLYWQKVNKQHFLLRLLHRISIYECKSPQVLLNPWGDVEGSIMLQCLLKMS